MGKLGGSAGKNASPGGNPCLYRAGAGEYSAHAERIKDLASIHGVRRTS